MTERPHLRSNTIGGVSQAAPRTAVITGASAGTYVFGLLHTTHPLLRHGSPGNPPRRKESKGYQPGITYIAPAAVPPVSTPGAPIMMSSKPSPLRSAPPVSPLPR